MSKTTLNNGTGRKRLADQLDRLDGILDALSDGLNEAVASAVEKAVGQAVTEAVQAVMVELLTNPAFHEMKKAASIPEPAAPTKEPTAAPTRLSSLWSWTTGKVRAAARTCTSAVKQPAGLPKLAWQTASTGVKTVVLTGTAAVAGTVYVTRSSITAGAKVVFGWGKGLLEKAGNALASVLPSFAFGI